MRRLLIRQDNAGAVREAEFACIRQAYLERPDSEAEAGGWSTAEEYKL